MKKIMAILFALALSTAISACEQNTPNSPENSQPIVLESPAPTPSSNKQEEQLPSSTPTQEPTVMQEQSDKITPDEAKTTALSHAGLNAGDVKFLKAELDRENGKLVYDVEFEQGRVEYDYEIDAVSGAILKFDKEYDD
ncbi:MAG: PepSY domain-containing protein [Clostridia bacterium]|nr:PepSY domain-containing protein [Clostridia bacterium]